jgi:SulP family sulfate permease
VAVNIVLGQLADLLGSPQEGSPAVVKAWNVVTHPSQISLAAAAVGISALALIVLLTRTRIASVASLVALVVPTLASLSVSGLVRVADSGPIPTGIPTPHLPQLSLLTSLQLISGAAAVAVIVLVQGTGVAEAAPNPDGSLPDPNRDFIGQGLGNLASGLFRGQPVGGSVSQTALNVAAGARTQWAAIFSGLWMLLILVAFSGVVGQIPVPTLAAVLIFAAASSLRVARIDTVLRAGLPSRVGFFATLAATLALPVAAAVGVGVLLSLLLQLNQEAVDLSVVRLALGDEGRFAERELPAKLPSEQVTVIDVHGSLLFAGARTLQARLPDPAESRTPVVVLRLRGRAGLSATGLIVLADYAERLERAGGHLFLSGVDARLLDQLASTKRVSVDDNVTVVPASATLLQSTFDAREQAEEWLAHHVTVCADARNPALKPGAR